MLRLAWSHDSANACLAASSITLMYHHWSQEEAARGNQECHNVRSWIRCWGTSVWTGAGRSDHHQLILRVNEGQTGQRRSRYSDLELHKHWWLLFPSCHKYQDFVWIVVAHVFKLRVSRSSGIMIFPSWQSCDIISRSSDLRKDTTQRLCSTVELLTFLCNVGRLPFNYVFVLKQIESLDFQLRRQQM